ncbi:MAG: NAD(P)/FAD-dependent oxidoreductase [Bacillota bacterium]
MTKKIVIIGDGVAAITAIKSIREIDKNSEIHLFGEERFYPYNRIRLSKGILSTLEEDKILLQKKEWYEENNVQLYVGQKVISINPDKKTIGIADNNQMNYDKLLISSGAHNFKPPMRGIDKKGVYSLRTLQDAWTITEQIKNAQKILVIGGGIQGLETAWALSQMNKKVIITELLPKLMPKQLDERASRILEEAVKSYGVEIMLETQLDEILGTENVEAVKLSTGNTITCDMILYSIGIKPNIEILENTQVKTNIGIIVNNRMETNIRDIYGAGDVAELDGQIYGLWNISIGHGKVAGLNIAGEDSRYEHIVPVTTLNAFNISLFSMGIVEEEKATHIVFEEKTEEKIYNKIFINNNKVIGAIVIGDIKHSPVLKTTIEKEIDLDDIDYSRVSFDNLVEIIKKNK